MALEIKKTSALIDPEAIRLKVLIYGMHGSGKTTWMATAPTIGVGVCETGFGRGLLSVASKEFDYTELNAYSDFEQFASGAIFKDKDTLCLDSLSEMVRTFIKDKALSIPRAKGESAKRAAGVLELDDYGVVAELTRKLLQRLINQPKHIIVTSGLRIDRPDMETGQGDMLIGPDLSGQLFLGSTAMFDIVLCLRTRQVLRDPKDAKSKITERYLITENQGVGGVIAKNRLSESGVRSFLPPEIVINPETGVGNFPWFLSQAKLAYAKFLAAQVKV